MGVIALNPIFQGPKIDLELVSPAPLASPSPTPLFFKPNLNKEIQLIKKYSNKRGEIFNVRVTAKDATSITIDNNGTAVKVTYEANTHFRRRFWGKSSFAEISVGDNVDVIGRWTNEERTQLKAVLIRNLSIQKRYGVFFGTVKSITDTGFVMETIHRGEETVLVGTTAKLIDRTENAIKIDDILAGHRVRIRGLWDSEKFTITEVTEIKDFSLPPQAPPEASSE